MPVHLNGSSVGVAACVGGEVPRAVVHQRPVHELGARVVAIGVVVKHIRQGELSRGQGNAGGVHLSGNLILAARHQPATATQAPRLADEEARQADLGAGIVDAVDFAVRKPGDPKRGTQPIARENLGIDADLRAIPQFASNIERGGE